MKFEFKPPHEKDPKDRTSDDFEEQQSGTKSSGGGGDGEVEEETRSLGEESLEGSQPMM